MEGGDVEQVVAIAHKGTDIVAISVGDERTGLCSSIQPVSSSLEVLPATVPHNISRLVRRLPTDATCSSTAPPEIWFMPDTVQRNEPRRISTSWCSPMHSIVVTIAGLPSS